MVSGHIVILSYCHSHMIIIGCWLIFLWAGMWLAGNWTWGGTWTIRLIVPHLSVSHSFQAAGSGKGGASGTNLGQMKHMSLSNPPPPLFHGHHRWWVLMRGDSNNGISQWPQQPFVLQRKCCTVFRKGTLWLATGAFTSNVFSPPCIPKVAQVAQSFWEFFR